MKPEAAEILRECLRRTLVIAAGGNPDGRTFVFRYDGEFQRENGPWWHAGDWFGGGRRLPEARRQRYVRALHSLEAAGDVETCSKDGGKTDHVRLTPQGREKAVCLEGMNVPELVSVLPATPRDRSVPEDPR